MNGPRAIRIRQLRALTLLVACFLSAAALAQSMPTASRPGDIQFGGGFTLGRSGYNFNKLSLTGGTAYATFDKRDHWGFEAAFHQVKPSSDPTIYERTYELGPASTSPADASPLRQSPRRPRRLQLLRQHRQPRL